MIIITAEASVWPPFVGEVGVGRTHDAPSESVDPMFVHAPSCATASVAREVGAPAHVALEYWLMATSFTGTASVVVVVVVAAAVAATSAAAAANFKFHHVVLVAIPTRAWRSLLRVAEVDLSLDATLVTLVVALALRCGVRMG